MASIVDVNDFVNGPLADSGISVTYTPAIKTYDDDGNEELTPGTGVTITAVVHLNINQHTITQYGLQKSTDGYVMVGPNQAISKDDTITVGSQVYRITNVRQRGPSGEIVFYKFCELVLIQG